MKSIHVLRKPCSRSAPTVAANVLRHGTGGLNIDMTRVPTTPSERSEMLTMSQGFAGRKWGRPEVANYGYVASMPVKTVSIPSDGGRWPANLVLQHLDGCVQDGVKKVGSGKFVSHDGVARSSPMMSPERGWNGNNLNNSKKNAPNQYGTETVAAWTCAPGCPVAALDAQSGNAGGGFGVRGRGGQTYANGAGFANSLGEVGQKVGFGDTGGASRFFKQVKP